MAEVVSRAGRHERGILIPLTPEPRVILEMWCRSVGGTFEVTGRAPEEAPIRETYVCRFPPRNMHIAGRGYVIGKPGGAIFRGIYGELTLDRRFDVRVMELEGDFTEKPTFGCKFAVEQPPRFSFECNVGAVSEVSFEYNRRLKKLKVTPK